MDRHTTKFDFKMLKSWRIVIKYMQSMSFFTQCVSSSAVLKSLDGTTKPAIDIFAYAIRYLKDHLLNALKLETGRLVHLLKENFSFKS